MTLAEDVPVHLPSATMSTMRPLVESTLREVEARSGIPFAVRFAGGESRVVLGRNGEPAFTVIFRRPRAYWRMALFGHVGLLESYFDGDIDIEGNLAPPGAGGRGGVPARHTGPPPLLTPAHVSLKNTGGGGRARHNAEFHYSLTPEFYKLWLDDPLMFYTCA